MKTLYYITIALIATGAFFLGAAIHLFGGIAIGGIIGVIVQIILASVCGNYIRKKGGDYHSIFLLTFWLPIVGFVITIFGGLFLENRNTIQTA